LITAAAQNSPALTVRRNSENQYAKWLQRQPEATKHQWLVQLMEDPNSAVRREILSEFQKSTTIHRWPTVALGRTLAELQAAAEKIKLEMDQRKAEKAARLRAKRRTRR